MAEPIGAGRAEVHAARRVVVKVGSSSLTSAEGGIDPARVTALVDTVAAVRRRGEAAAQDLAQDGQVGAVAEQSLHAAVGQAEARHHLVGDE